MKASRALALGVIASLIGIVLIMDAGFRHPVMVIVSRIPGKDVTVHFVLMGVACAAAIQAFPGARIAGRRLGITGMTVMVLLVVTLEEISQAWVPGRTASMSDLLASQAGIGMAALIMGAIRRHHAEPRRAE